MKDTLYACRVSYKGKKPFVIRLSTELEARQYIQWHKDRGVPTKYVGKVILSKLNKRK